MHRKIIALLTGVGLMISGTASAYDNNYIRNYISEYGSMCPQVVLDAAEENFGEGAGEMTECLAKRDRIRAVVAFNSGVINKRNGHGQQVLNVRNIEKDYTNNYEMEIGDDFKVVVIGYAAGARWLLNDTAFNKSYGTENPSDNFIAELIGKGIKFYMCQNTMKGNGWKKEDLLPGVNMVPAGVTAVLDYEHRGYKYIAP